MVLHALKVGRRRSRADPAFGFAARLRRSRSAVGFHSRSPLCHFGEPSGSLVSGQVDDDPDGSR